MKTAQKSKYQSKYAYNVANGICTRCHTRKAENGVKVCKACEKKKLAYMREYQARNREAIASYKRSIRPLENARKRTSAYKERKNLRRNVRLLTDPQYIASCRLYRQLGRAIRDRNLPRLNKSTCILVGCSIGELTAHIESQFLPGMSWENRKEWHVDHIRPLSTFDLTSRAHQLECFHFTNLRPLWALDNIKRKAA